jgi:hypothetical protein
MDDLTARLQALFRRYSAAIELHPDRASIDHLCEQFHQDLGGLIAEYGHAAVDEAIDEIPSEVWPSVGLH